MAWSELLRHLPYSSYHLLHPRPSEPECSSICHPCIYEYVSVHRDRAGISRPASAALCRFCLRLAPSAAGGLSKLRSPCPPCLGADYTEAKHDPWTAAEVRGSPHSDRSPLTTTAHSEQPGLRGPWVNSGYRDSANAGEFMNQKYGNDLLFYQVHRPCCEL